MPYFSNCRFEYSSRIFISLGNIPTGAICLYNYKAIIENSIFLDNFSGVEIRNQVQGIIIKDNNFIYIDEIHPSLYGFSITKIRSTGLFEIYAPVLVAGNYFEESNAASIALQCMVRPLYAVNNTFCGNVGIRYLWYLWSGVSSFFFENEFLNCITGIDAHSVIQSDSLYIKKNNFIGGNDGIDINYAYVEISDNYFEECDLYSGIQNTGKAYNNISYDGNFRLPGYLEVYNNISFNGNYVGVEVSWRNISCQNNLTINNDYAIGSGGSVTYKNCVFVENEEINYFPISGNPIFRNCILDFELPPECIDGGGNIWVDSLQAQQLFEDIQNGDFHLIEGSQAIDAGFDTLGYYYPFDLDYNHRVWDGDNNGTAIIDIGPYEYNSPSFGGIEGYTYNPVTGDPVDYVLLKINNQPGEFTFSDSLGSFEYKLPAGIYDVYAERVFYEDVIEYQVEVFDGQFTQVLIPMLETVDVENIQYSIYNFQLSNYPNPFNPTTTICFETTNLQENSRIEIFNIKGQKVKTLECDESLVTKADGVGYSITWNGKDSNDKNVASGLYFYKLSSGKETQVKKMLLLK